MKTLYEAADGVEAHMILNLLEQEGINGRVDGEYLQGGIGGLPAAGLVRVMVPEEDYAAAKQIVDKWNVVQPARADAAPTPAPVKSGGRLIALLVGLAIGVLGTSAYFRTPVSSDRIDYNHDGVTDDKWTYSSSGQPLRNEVDRNLDGKVDYTATPARDGTIESVSADDDFNGVFESVTVFKQGTALRTETDTDGDGYNDFKTNYASGVLVSTEYINPTTGLPRKIEHYKFGKLTYAESDTDLDGKPDKRSDFDELGNVTSTSDIK